jgi:hypothetical protein
MDEMKQGSEIDDALRSITKQRDRLLCKALTLSRARQAALTGFLARVFPLEAALREAVTKRDQLLHRQRPRIPASAESILHRQLDALLAGGRPRAPRKLDGLKPSSLSMQRSRGDGVRIFDLRGRTRVWLTFFRSPLGIALTACTMIVAAVLCFGSWRTSSRRQAALPNTPRLDEVSTESGTDLFTRGVSIGSFNLNTNEPASLQASFLGSTSMRLADGIEAPLGLRLDLPVRTILVEDTLARTP